MSVRTAARSEQMRGDEEAFLWATAALGEAREHSSSRAGPALEALLEDLAFDLGARSFPPKNARASRTPARSAPTDTRGRARTAGRV